VFAGGRSVAVTNDRDYGTRSPPLSLQRQLAGHDYAGRRNEKLPQEEEKEQTRWPTTIFARSCFRVYDPAPASLSRLLQAADVLRVLSRARAYLISPRHRVQPLALGVEESANGKGFSESRAAALIAERADVASRTNCVAFRALDGR